MDLPSTIPPVVRDPVVNRSYSMEIARTKPKSLGSKARNGKRLEVVDRSFGVANEPDFHGFFTIGTRLHWKQLSGSSEVQPLSNMTASRHNRFYRVRSRADWADPPTSPRPALPARDLLPRGGCASAS
jgi:hypothetical protein